MTSFLEKLAIPKLLLVEHVEAVDTPIRLEEMKAEIGVLRANTAPGPNGFMVEFYKKFEMVLAGHMQELFPASARK